MQDRQQTRYRVSDLVNNVLLQLAGLLCVSGVLFSRASKVVNSVVLSLPFLTAV